MPLEQESVQGKIEKSVDAGEPESLQGTLERVVSVEREIEPSPPRERDGRGRFTAKDDDDGGAEQPSVDEPKVEDPEAKAEPPAASQAGPPAASQAGPPPGYSVETKAGWEQLPQHARDDIIKRENEVSAGFQRYAGLGRFAEGAERNGTSLQQAVQDYVDVETTLRRDFVGGIEYICRRLGEDPHAVAKAMATKYQIASGDLDSLAATEQSRLQQQIDPMAIAAHAASTVRQEIEQKESNATVAAFAADPKNKYFENVRLDMAMLVNRNKDTSIENAYQEACWLNPGIRAIMIKEAKATDQAAAAASRSRNAAKSIGGAPAGGVSQDSRRRGRSLEETINDAIDDQMSSA